MRSIFEMVDAPEFGEEQSDFEFMVAHFKGDIISSPFIDTEYNKMMRAQTRLEGFEKVLGEKFYCYKHCKKYMICGKIRKICEDFRLYNSVIAEIKLKDLEIAETKIDTHPRFLIGKITPTQSLDWFGLNPKPLHNYINNKTVKLVIIL